MNTGDKIAIVEGEYMGRFGYIKTKVNNTYKIKLDDTEEIVYVQGYEIDPYEEEF